MEQIKWGMIGCGDVTEVKSGPAFNKVGDSELVAVMSRNASRAADYAARHRVHKWYTDAFTLINDPGINAIYIATPPSSHLQYARAAMEAGKAVYVEKPMTLNLAEACTMAGLADALEAKLTVAHYRRAQPKFIKIKELLDTNVIGQTQFCRMLYLRPSLTQAELSQSKTAWRVNPEISGGGLFHDLAPHQLDLMLYFFGKVSRSMGVSLNQCASYPADDMVTGSIQFNSGLIFSGLWNFSAGAGRQADECEIVGTEGTIRFSIFGKQECSLTVKGEESLLSFDPLLHVQEPMIREVVRFFRDKGPNPCSAGAGVEVMNLMDAFSRR